MERRREEYVGNGLWKQAPVGNDYATANLSYQPLPRGSSMTEREMTMVEWVARALSIADGMHPEAASNDDDEQPAWTLYVDMAKAAIEAMVEAGGEANYGWTRAESIERDKEASFDERASNAKVLYQAVIDAALKEHEG